MTCYFTFFFDALPLPLVCGAEEDEEEEEEEEDEEGELGTGLAKSWSLRFSSGSFMGV
jgi:hypothetical protein